MSIIYNSNSNHYTHNNNPVIPILGTHDMRKSNVCKNGHIRSRTKDGGFVAWPENISVTHTDTVEEISVNRTRSGGFIAWPE
jgi:hypothetical protein